MAITAFFFGVFHLSLHRFPAVFLIGLAACFVVWISGSIFAGMLLHALSNGFVTFLGAYPQYDFLGLQAMRPSLLVLPGIALIALGVHWGLKWRQTAPA
jgi:hypothetical protein